MTMSILSTFYVTPFHPSFVSHSYLIISHPISSYKYLSRSCRPFLILDSFTFAVSCPHLIAYHSLMNVSYCLIFESHSNLSLFSIFIILYHRISFVFESFLIHFVPISSDSPSGLILIWDNRLHSALNLRQKQHEWKKFPIPEYPAYPCSYLFLIPVYVNPPLGIKTSLHIDS